MERATKIDRKKYVFIEYSEEYPALFEEEKVKLRKILGKEVEIEHVGSTSIPGLGGKGIIDIAIMIPKEKVKEFKEKLGKVGYFTPSDHPENEKSIFLKKKIKYGNKESYIHVHLTLTREFWDSFILFRDHLRNNKKDRYEYARIKKEGAIKAKGAADVYREHKKSFLENTMKKVMSKINTHEKPK